MTRATATIAMLANKQNKNIKELFENVAPKITPPPTIIDNPI